MIYVGIFLRIQNNLKLSFCIILLMKQKIFLGVSSASWFFFWGGGARQFLCRDFLGFVRNPTDFFFGGERFDFCPHLSIPVT